jgi:hypothetical protein
MRRDVRFTIKEDLFFFVEDKGGKKRSRQVWNIFNNAKRLDPLSKNQDIYMLFQKIDLLRMREITSRSETHKCRSLM